jgi:hypothetical protein
VHGLVAAVHRDEVHVHVDEEVALGDAAADADLLAPLRLTDYDVPVRVLGVVVVEPVGVVAGHDLLAQAVPKLCPRHPPVEAQGRYEMYVFDALRGGLLQYLFDDLLSNVWPPHRWQGYGEVVEGDGELHAGTEKIVQGLHVHRLE